MYLTAIVKPPPTKEHKTPGDQVRMHLTENAVLLYEESEIAYKVEGLEAASREQENGRKQEEPMADG